MHSLPFVKKLWPDSNVTGCADATYLHSQKSQNNHQHEKQTYCMYKGRNMQKEHVLCTTEGYVISADGPHFADGHNADAIMLDHQIHDIMRKNQLTQL